MLAPNFLITYKLKEKKTGRKYGAVKKKKHPGSERVNVHLNLSMHVQRISVPSKCSYSG